ncbi:MAG: glucose-6-phosphate isomerase [Verrucomicrobiota bacterium]|jgi:polyphosphate glucokinase
MHGRILVADIGGTQVKVMTSPKDQIKFDSGGDMRPRDFVERFRENVKGLKFDRLSIGFPAPVRNGKIVRDPKHLGKGWAGFNFTRALHKPTRVINDAAMQALGSYARGRILFLGLGTGLGSALVWRNYVLPLELGDLPYRNHRKIEDFLGKEGLEKLGRKAWRAEVLYAVRQLKLSFVADTIVLGGGNVAKMNELPRGIEKGDNRNAFLGGVRLWEMDRRTGKPRWQIL